MRRRSKKLLAATIAVTSVVTGVAPAMALATDGTMEGSGPEKTYLVTFESSAVPIVANATDPAQMVGLAAAADGLEARRDVVDAEPVAGRVAVVTSNLTAAQLDSLPGIAKVEEDRPVQLAADPSEGSQWYLENTGGSYGGFTLTPDADIDAQTAWDTTTGSGVTVAIIDSGVQLTHPDLAAQIWTNAGETSCSDGVDNDANGYVDDCNGWDFGANDKNPNPDTMNHGTHVAGITGAARNGAGIVGVAPGARIMALKIDNAAGTIFTSAGVAAIYYAADNGAKVINLSWGSGSPSSTLEAALAYAGTKGTVAIAAAGNSAQTLTSGSTFYPAGYWSTQSNVVSIASSTPGDVLSSFSNRGLVTLAAPGSAILSTLPGGSYGVMQGTSMASPVAAGVAALVMASENLTPAQVRQRLVDTVDHPSGLGSAAGAGRINAANAVSGTPGGGGGGGGGDAVTTTTAAPVTTTSTTARPVALPGAPTRLVALGVADRVDVSFAAVRGYKASPILNYTVKVGDETTTVPASGPFTARFTGLQVGSTYSVSVWANVATGAGTAATTTVATGTASAAPNATAIPGFASVKVGWPALRSYAGKVAITGYRIEAGGTTTELRASARTATLNDLTGGSPIDITITVLHGASTGASTTLTGVTPLATVAPGSPGAIAATPRRNQVVVYWTTPADGLATSYKVTVGTTTRTVNAKVRSLSARAAAGPIEVSVVAVNPYGESSPLTQSVTVFGR